MKKRIWIKVDKLRLSGLKTQTRIPGQKNNEKYAWGELEIGNPGFVLRSLLITLRKGSGLSQNDAQSNMRFLDVPIKHRLRNGGKPPRRHLLKDVIALAVADEYLRRRKEELLPIFSNSKNSFDFPWFSPPEWRGSLRIPVEFIRLFNFECQLGGPVFAHIQVGHHLVFWHAPIYKRHHPQPFSCHSQDINDPRILTAINRLLVRRNVRIYLKGLTEHSQPIADETEFIDAIPGCQTDSLPPRIRFY